MLALMLAPVSFGDDKKDEKKDDKPAERQRPNRGNFQPGNFQPGAFQPGNIQDLLKRFTEGQELLTSETKEKLKLSKEQQEKVDKIVKDYDAKQKESLDKMKETMQKLAGGNREGIREALTQMREMRQDLQKLRDDAESKLNTVLNDDQKKTYAANKKDTPRIEFPFGNTFPVRPGAATPPGTLFSKDAQEKLNLTAEQKEKLEKLQKSVDEQIQNLLSDEQKKTLEDLKKSSERRTPFERPNRPEGRPARPNRPGNDK
jgi:hypothetical protein